MSNMESKEQQILEGNKLIAEFLGFKFHKKLDVDFSDCGGIYDRTDVWSKVEILSEDYPESDQFYISDEWKPAIGDVIYGELKYHSSWNELMLVVEKISALTNPKWRDKPDFCIISEGTSGYTVWQKNVPGDQNQPQFYKDFEEGDIWINNVWLAVVEFIKWYKHIK